MLIAGGSTASGPSFDIEIHDPSSGTSVHAGNMTLPRVDHAAATLKDGRVLIVGGSDGVSPLSVVEMFDPATGQSVGIAAAMSAARMKATATTMLDGHVLVVGGSDGTNDLSSAEIFDPADGSFFATGGLQTGRSGHSAVLLPNNNQVLIAGGMSAAAAVASAELYADWRNGFSTTPSPMSAPRAGAIAGGLQPYDVAFVGGGGSTTSEYYGYATVKTDKDDYQPGEIVTITGSGWQPGETVTLKVSEDADTHFDWNLIALADAQGNFVNQDFYPRQDAQFQHIGMRFYVMATGAASQALTTFTDGALKIKSATWPGSASPRTFGVTVQPFTGSTNCTTGGGAITSGTADNNGLNTGNIGSGDSWQVVANLTANAPNASFTFSSWSNPDALTISPNLTSRTICVRGFQSGTRELIGNYVANTAPVAINEYVHDERRRRSHGRGARRARQRYGFEWQYPYGCPSPGEHRAEQWNTFVQHKRFIHLYAQRELQRHRQLHLQGKRRIRRLDSVCYRDDHCHLGERRANLYERGGPDGARGRGRAVRCSVGNQHQRRAGQRERADTDLLRDEYEQLVVFGSALGGDRTERSRTPRRANTNGSATVTVRLTDNGGTANGGVDFSEQTFTITVTPVNDAPSFTRARTRPSSRTRARRP